MEFLDNVFIEKDVHVQTSTLDLLFDRTPGSESLESKIKIISGYRNKYLCHNFYGSEVFCLFISALDSARRNSKSLELFKSKMLWAFLFNFGFAKRIKIEFDVEKPLNQIGIKHPYVCANFDWWPDSKVIKML